MKYFLFNKASDYQRGFGENVVCGPRGISVRGGYGGRAVFWSRILDSAEEGNIWHRMTCSVPEPARALVKISFYTSDEISFEEGDRTRTVREILCSEKMSFSEKREFCRPFLRKEEALGKDTLLHSLTGRYLWFLLEIYPQTEETVEIGDFAVFFQAESWMNYLPEIYRRETGNDSFLDRYLAVYQSLYDDISWQMREFVRNLDPGTADPEFLKWLASWMGIDETYMWTEKQLRYLLGHVMEFYESRGTRRGIELFVELYTGEPPFVIEWQDWEGFEGEYGRLLKSLYVDNPESFTVLVREECIPTYKEHQALLRVIEQIKPVQMELHLIVLEPYIFTGGYSYLGVNSVLGQYERSLLDANSKLEFATLQKTEKENGLLQRQTVLE